MSGFPTLPQGADIRRIVEVVQRLLQGKMNATTTLTLTANAGSTTLTDARIGGSSHIGWTPLTANASAEVGAGTIYVSARVKGSATIAHANNAQTDRDFSVLIIG